MIYSTLSLAIPASVFAMQSANRRWVAGKTLEPSDPHRTSCNRFILWAEKRREACATIGSAAGRTSCGMSLPMPEGRAAVRLRPSSPPPSPRKCGHLSQPKVYISECDDGGIVSSGLLETCCHASGLFEFAAATLDEVTLRNLLNLEHRAARE